MACKFNAPNGQKSELYDKLLTRFNASTAIKVWANTKTNTFKTWYGNGVTDNNGEPVLNNINEFVNAEGVTQSIDGHVDYPISLEQFTHQIDNLTDIFTAAGLRINVQLDGDMQEMGSVITLNDNTQIKFNPRKAKRDSVFHEFGHIYIDMLGDNHKLVERGIELLKGSLLETKLKKLYPTLNEAQFGKELLTTAVGIEAAHIYDMRSRIRGMKGQGLLENIKGWRSWVEYFFESIARVLGIGQTPVKKLAYNLASFNLKYTLTGKPATYLQKQVAPMTVEQLAEQGRTRIRHTSDAGHYMVDNDESNKLDRVTTAIDKFKGIFDRESALTNARKGLLKEGIVMTEEELAILWADKREEGTVIHAVSEDYIMMRNKGESRDAARKYVLDNVRQTKGGVDENGIRIYTGGDRDLVEGYVDNIIKFIDHLYAQGYKLYSEVKVFDKELGVAGTIDLLIEKPDGSLMIYDWKTKEKGKFKDFYSTKGEYVHEALQNLTPNKANDYALQLSTYALILRRMGFKVGDMGIIGLEGDIVTDENGENRYANIRVFQDDNTKTNPDGVLILSDLADQLEDIYIEKEDIEAILDEAEDTEQTIEDMFEQVSKLDNLSQYITDIILNLKRSISRMKATANPEDAERFERIAKEMIKKLMVEDEMQAIAAYTKFITNNLIALYSRFQDHLVTDIDENGNEVYRLNRGYDSWTWQKMKDADENNPEQYMEFLSFLINADMFVEQAVYIQNIPMTDSSQHNLVLAALKKTEGTISDLKLKIKHLNKELDYRYAELSSNPLHGGRGTLENTKDFFKAQEDETFMQSNFDALADTHNKYLANVMRLFDYRKRKMQDEVKIELEKWQDSYDELINAGGSIDRFIDRTTGKVVPKINWNEYFRSRGEMFRSVEGKDKKTIRNAMNKWFNANVEPLSQEEKRALNKRKLDELGKAGFKDWQNKQLFKGKWGKNKGVVKDSKTGAYYKPKETVWGNPTFASYNETERKFYNYLTNTLSYLVEHTKDSIIKNGYLPAVPINDKGFFEQLMNSIGWRDKGVYDADRGVIEDEQGNVVQFLPFVYNNLLNQKKYHAINKTDSEDVKRDLREKNRQIDKDNKAAHAAAINMNLVETMPAFIRTALNHKHKKNMEFELLRVRKSFADNHKVLLLKNGKAAISKSRKAAGLEDTTIERTTVGSNASKHYEAWLRMIFYEEFEMDEGTWQKVARVLQNFTSFKGMALNPLSAINNQIFGTITSLIEANAGLHFSKKDWARATLEYNKNIASYFAGTQDDTRHNSKMAAIFDYFNIMQDFTELDANVNKNNSIGSKSLKALGWVSSKAYAMQHLSEHNLQNRVLLAMAYSHRLVNGRIISFDEYKRGKLKDVHYKNQTAEENKAAIQFNKTETAKLQESFNKEQNVLDLFDFEDGRLKVKKDIKMEESELAEFQRKALGVNQYLHGIYNKEDAGTMQQYALGRLAIQFRKWMRSGWTKRWGTRMGKSHWNERRNMLDEGYYQTTMRFLGRPMLDAWTEYKDKKGTEEQIGVLSALGNIFKGYGQMLTNFKVHYHTLSDNEKANVIRTFTEYFTFCALVGILYLLKDMKGGDDDEPNAALLLALYQTDRTITEMTTFVPVAVAPGYVGGGWLNESKKILKSPTATFNLIESGIKISQHILMYPFSSSEDLVYESGVYAGQNRLATELVKNIPIYNQISRLQNLAKNYKHYKLF